MSGLTTPQKRKLISSIHQGKLTNVKEIIGSRKNLTKTPHNVAKYVLSEARQAEETEEQMKRRQAIENATKEGQPWLTRLFKFGGKRRTQKQKRKSRKYTRKH